jgi:hypothetical protein
MRLDWYWLLGMVLVALLFGYLAILNWKLWWQLQNLRDTLGRLQTNLTLFAGNEEAARRDPRDGGWYRYLEERGYQVYCNTLPWAKLLYWATALPELANRQILRALRSQLRTQVIAVSEEMLIILQISEGQVDPELPKRLSLGQLEARVVALTYGLPLFVLKSPQPEEPQTDFGL